MNDFELGEAGKELEALQKYISKLEIENERLKAIVVDNNIEDEVEDIDCTSIEEKICRDGIRYIGSLVESQDFDKNDIASFQILFNTLRTIRGTSVTTTKKQKKMNVKDLLKIVEKV